MIVKSFVIRYVKLSIYARIILYSKIIIDGFDT